MSLASPSPQGQHAGLWADLPQIVPCALTVLADDGRVLIWNLAAQQLLGWQAEEVVARAGRDQLLAAAHVSTAEMLRTVGAGRDWQGVLQVRRRDGATLSCQAHARAIDRGGSRLTVLVFSEVQEDYAKLLLREKAAREEAERARDRLAFAVHANSRLALSLDVADTLRILADLVLPDFGSFCVLDRWDGQRLERVYAGAADGHHPELLSALRAADADRPGHPAVEVARSGRPQLLGPADAERVAAAYVGEHDGAAELRASARHGCCAVPLVTRGRVTGVLSLIGPAELGLRDLTADDIPVIEQLANRAALSIENASTLADERRTASRLAASERAQRQAAGTLQHSLLPGWSHRPDGLEVVARYLPDPTAADVEVGGDWFDLVSLGPGRTALVVGDVMGRGLRAATAMGQMRTAVRAYARLDLPPDRIFALMDGLLADLAETEIVTCGYAVFDAPTRTLTCSSAGHPPLLLVEPPGAVRRVPHAARPPLGVPAEHATGAPSTLRVAPGTLLVCYTDGLVEHLTREVDAGIEQLARTLAGASGPLEAVCDRVLTALRPPEGYDDDVALLLARVT